MSELRLGCVVLLPTVSRSTTMGKIRQNKEQESQPSDQTVPLVSLGLCYAYL